MKDYFGSKQFQDLFESAVCGAVRSEMQKMRDQLDIANGKLMDLEVSVKGKDKVIADLQAQAERQSEKIFTLKEKANEAEQYSRRNCVRLYGIPEAKPLRVRVRVSERTRIAQCSTLHRGSWALI